MSAILDLVRRGWRKPPDVIVRWLWRKAVARRAATQLPKLAKDITGADTARRLGFSSFDELLSSMRDNTPFPVFNRDSSEVADALGEASKANTMRRADLAVTRTVDFLGSGPCQLSTPIDWATDFKSGITWPVAPSDTLNVLDLDRPSDIKVPWELSRLQWLLPVGQAYVLSGDERYAAFAREIIEEWIQANPICIGPNWLCAMDVALRAISMTWLFSACRDSNAWSDSSFLERIVPQLYLHMAFVDTHLEWSDVAGNHLTTDLAGLVVVGLALGGNGDAKKWADKGWRLLEEQFPQQVPNDGVCREASTTYHRLVAELFLLPALARKVNGLTVASSYWAHLEKMANFVESYIQPGGTIPIWGDADDGRVLPLGTQKLSDHRYLVETLRSLNDPPKTPVYDETIWWLGYGSGTSSETPPPASTQFPDAGVYILRSNDDHVFVDAGPVGMAGRGGHGHNDCLSFEAVLRGTRLIIDPGCYVYTSDWRARNRFRGTETHNTPFIDNEEINRIPRDDWLWYLENDAVPEIHEWTIGADADTVIASHSGYRRLAHPVTPVRAIRLFKRMRSLVIHDRFVGIESQTATTRFTLAPGIVVEADGNSGWRLTSGQDEFVLRVEGGGAWKGHVIDAEYSPSYGVKENVSAIAFETSGALKPLTIGIFPKDQAPDNPSLFLGQIADELATS